MAKRNAIGITSIRELSLWPQGVAALERMRREHKLTVRMAIGVTFPDESQTAKHLAELPAIKRDDPWLFLDCTGEEPWPPESITVDQYTAFDARGAAAGLATRATRGCRCGQRRELRCEHRSNACGVRGRRPPEPDQGSALVCRACAVRHAQPNRSDGPAWSDCVSPVSGVRATQSCGDAGGSYARINPIRDLIDHKIVVVGGSDYVVPLLLNNKRSPLLERQPDNPMIPFYSYVDTYDPCRACCWDQKKK